MQKTKPTHNNWDPQNWQKQNTYLDASQVAGSGNWHHCILAGKMAQLDDSIHIELRDITQIKGKENEMQKD